MDKNSILKCVVIAEYPKSSLTFEELSQGTYVTYHYFYNDEIKENLDLKLRRLWRPGVRLTVLKYQLPTSHSFDFMSSPDDITSVIF